MKCPIHIIQGVTDIWNACHFKEQGKLSWEEFEKVVKRGAVKILFDTDRERAEEAVAEELRQEQLDK